MTPAQRTAKRQRKHIRAMRRDRDACPYSEDHRAELGQACAFRAVQSVFAYLSLEQIAKPPRQLKDAQFARQVAIHIAVCALDVPQRQIVRLQGRQRTSIHFALRTVDMRLEGETFAAAYARMAETAQALYREQTVNLTV